MTKPVKLVDIGGYWDETLTEFAFRVYGEPKIEDVCLRLQKTYSVNINILLWLMWLKDKNIHVNRNCLEDALLTVDTLSQVTVNRLREIRQLIKESPGFNRVQSSMICKHILNAEVSTEKVLLQRLQDLTSKSLDSKQNATPNDVPTLSIAYYLDFMNVPDAHLFSDSLSIFCEHVNHTKPH